MDRIGNPFEPGAGTEPPELVGRRPVVEEARIALARIKAGRFEKSIILIGLRGVGKTVLLNRIQLMAKEAGYHSEFIESPEKDRLPELLVPALRRILLSFDTKEQISTAGRAAWHALKAFAKGFKVKVGDVEVGMDLDHSRGIADSGMLERDLTDLIVSIGEAAKASKKCVAILIDELQYLKEPELAALITALHRVSQLKLPVILFGAGLPQIAGLSGDAKSYSERLFSFITIGALNDVDAGLAISEPILRAGEFIAPEAITEITRVTGGYPYFLQEWGYHAWNVAEQSPITVKDVQQATIDATKRLDESFFRVRFDRLTPQEKQYLRAMAELGPGPHRSCAISDVLGKKVSQVAPARDSLIKKGMIYSQSHGDTAFTVPLFDVFMKRVVPKLETT
jgi:AAA ATPase domain